MNQKPQEMRQRDAGDSRKPKSKVQVPSPIPQLKATPAPKSTRRKNNLLKELQSFNTESKNLQLPDIPTGFDPTELFMTRNKAKELQAIARDTSGRQQTKPEPIILEHKKARPTRKTTKIYTPRLEIDDQSKKNNNDVDYDVEEEKDKDDTDDDVGIRLRGDESSRDNARTNHTRRSYDTRQPRHGSSPQINSVSIPEEQTKVIRLNLKRVNGLAAWGRWRERKGT